MGKTTNRELLAQSFLELAGKKPVNKITVAQIAGNCGLSVPTFYRYFRDKYDLLAWKVSEDTLAILRGKSHSPKEVYLAWFQYIQDHQVFLRNVLLNTSGQDSFLVHVCSYHVELMLESIRRQRPDGEVPRDLEVLTRVYCYGADILATEFLLHRLDMEQEELACALEKCMPNALREYICTDR